MQLAIGQGTSTDIFDSGELSTKDKIDGIESESFLPVAQQQGAPLQSASEEANNISSEDGEDGSGGDDLPDPSSHATATSDPSDDDEGSGDYDASSESISREDEDNDSNESTNTTVPIIADSGERDGKSYDTDDTETTTNTPADPIVEEPIQTKNVTPVASIAANEPTVATTIRPDTETIKPLEGNVTHAGVARIGANKDSQATYVLLTCLGVILVLLIVYLVYKRYRSNSKHTHYINDAENAPQEMLNMNRNNIGKPMHSDDQCIHIPLIPDREKPNGVAGAEEPLLQKLSDTLPNGENGHCEPDGAVHAHIDHSPVSNGVHADAPHNGTATAIPHKSPRYSPVSSVADAYVVTDLFEISNCLSFRPVFRYIHTIQGALKSN